MQRFLTAMTLLAATLALMFFFTSRLESNLGTVVFARRSIPAVVSYLPHWHPGADLLPKVESLLEDVRVAARSWFDTTRSDQDDPQADGPEEHADTTTRKPMTPAP